MLHPAKSNSTTIVLQKHGMTLPSGNHSTVKVTPALSHGITLRLYKASLAPNGGNHS
jgi:hypothetical protein